MNRSDLWFRWSFNAFIFLMCFQLGMLLFLKSLYYKAEQKLKNNEAQVAFQCGDFDKEEAYWVIPSSKKEFSSLCGDSFCPDSYWLNKQEQTEDLHVISIVRPQPTRNVDGKVQYGHYVDVKVKPSAKPQTLVLVSQSMMQWNLRPEKNAKIKEVLVIGSELVWVDGLPEETKMTYFSKEQICAYPYALNEIANPENQFRRLFMALKSYTKQEITSFQGKEVGQEIRIPLQSPLLKEVEAERTVASVTKLSLGIHWKREDKRLVAESFHFLKDGKRKKVEIPAASTHGFYDEDSDQLFLINAFRFGRWDWKQKQFHPIHVSLKMPALYWPAAMAYDADSNEVYLYNDDRGGELYSYNIKNQKWNMTAHSLGYSFMALTFDKKKKALYGTRLQGDKLIELVEVGSQGEQKKVTLSKPLDFSKNLWRLQLVSDVEEMWLKVVHPAHPGGDVYPLSQSQM